MADIVSDTVAIFPNKMIVLCQQIKIDLLKIRQKGAIIVPGTIVTFFNNFR